METQGSVLRSPEQRLAARAGVTPKSESGNRKSAMSQPPPFDNPPQATLARVSRSRWVWVIPALAAVFALALVVTYIVKRGPVVRIAMRHGYGIKAGDVLRARGIVVGQVESVGLTGELEGVEVVVRLDPAAKEVARGGSRFWVMRPRVSLSGVAGLETIAGPRYLAVLPGEGERQGRFIALDEPPVVEAMEPDALEVVLTADRRGSLQPGAPVMYRQVAVGTVLSVGLSGDAASVEARAYIRPAYANLIRGNSRFWNASGVGVEASIKGFRFDLESLQSLVEGGVAFATPNDPGSPVNTGHRFDLAAKADDEWLEWRPALAVGSDLLPAGSPRPDMLRVTVNRRTGTIFRSTRQLKGWALPTSDGLIGPADLLQPSEQSNQLEVAGQAFDLTQAGPESPKVRVLPPDNVLALLQAAIKDARPWPTDRIRAMAEPEDCLIIADPIAPPISLPSTRLRRRGNGWDVDPSVSFDEPLHGASVIAQSDGKLIGLLLVERGTGSIAPLPVSGKENVNP